MTENERDDSQPLAATPSSAVTRAVNDLASRGLQLIGDRQRLGEMELVVAQLRQENEKLKKEYAALEAVAVELEHLAYHDHLTGLTNRTLFLDRLIVAMAQANHGGPNVTVPLCVNVK